MATPKFTHSSDELHRVVVHSVKVADDAAAVTEALAWRIGDGSAYTGIIIAIRRGEANEAAFPVFLMD
jgi:hypothetical protein